MLILYLGFDHNGHQDIIKKIIKFMLAQQLLLDHRSLDPHLPAARAPKWKMQDGCSFTCRANLVTSPAIIIARSFFA